MYDPTQGTIRLDVEVKDKSGYPVTGLGQQDFTHQGKFRPPRKGFIGYGISELASSPSLPVPSGTSIGSFVRTGSLNGVPATCSERCKLFYANRSLGKNCPDLQFAAHRLYEGTQGTHIHIRAFLHLGNRALRNLQKRSQMRLRDIACLSQFL
jgi:hypothetical protein